MTMKARNKSTGAVVVADEATIHRLGGAWEIVPEKQAVPKRKPAPKKKTD